MKPIGDNFGTGWSTLGLFHLVTTFEYDKEPGGPPKRGSKR